MRSQAILRKLKTDDAIHGLRLSSQAGWNQTIAEWNLIVNDPNSLCLAAELDNQIVATAAAINYSSDFSWIAMVLTDINYRNRGISKQLLITLFESIGDQRIIKLDATSLGQGLYNQFGFIEEYKIIRFIHNSPIFQPVAKHKNISIASRKDYKQVIRYDTAQFGADRTILFDWLQFSGYTYLNTEHGDFNGFICSREGRNYMHLGPLMSTNISYALELVEYSLSLNHTKPVIVDVPEYKYEMRHWFESNGFAIQREFIRMYKNKNMATGPLQDQYLIAGPEFG